MWMDHRAAEQADRITNTGHRVLSRVGGVMSQEMQPPKLLWLKEVRKVTASSSAICVFFCFSLFCFFVLFLLNQLAILHTFEQPTNFHLFGGDVKFA